MSVSRSAIKCHKFCSFALILIAPIVLELIPNGTLSVCLLLDLFCTQITFVGGNRYCAVVLPWYRAVTDQVVQHPTLQIPLWSRL